MPTTDVLTDVLETVRVGAACYGRVEAAAPWGIGVEADEEDAKFHVVLAGECWLDVDGQEPIHLTAVIWWRCRTATRTPCAISRAPPSAR